MSTQTFQTNYPALSYFVKTFGDAAQDFAAALQPGETLGQKLVAFENLIPDAMTDAADAGDLAKEVAALQSQDYADAAALLVEDCEFTSPHAVQIVASLVKFLGDGSVGDIWGVVQAVKTQPAAAAS